MRSILNALQEGRLFELPDAVARMTKMEAKQAQAALPAAEVSAS